ncbi:iron dicitrate transporter FecR [Fulvitalea axinellae]|uniref:Iron dicitrate transporter FecR n=1 Tax=Fulvitalea axinellae TaxID=1182444 RepID=A0AAU9D816_9BACT|nr:iron dicitrate transporter FecR [Fulvitalea axinellae]
MTGDDLIDKYLEASATEGEVKSLFAWVDESEENKAEFMRRKRLHALTGNVEISPGAWQKVQGRIGVQKRGRRMFLRFAKYAAVLALAFGLGFFVSDIRLNSPILSDGGVAMVEIVVPSGKTREIYLPDSSEVTVNAGSVLRYDPSFVSGRSVELEGEALFDIVTNKEKPFVVRTLVHDVKVYGTVFNVEAYPEDGFANTTLLEGSVGINDKQGVDLVRLNPGERAKYKKETGILRVEAVNPEHAMAWAEGRMVFRNVPLQGIAKKLERWYGVEINIRNKKLRSEPYWGTVLCDKPIVQIMEVLRQTSSLRYRIEKREDGPDLILWD